MDKFELDLSPYEIEGQFYPIKENLSNMLRAPGLFDSGNDIVEAVMLAKSIRDAKEVAKDLDNVDGPISCVLVLDEKELKILRDCMNTHLKLATEGKTNFGGPVHEECILRVFRRSE